MNYTTNNIRNVLIAGHGGAGKTSLAEALLYLTGGSDRLGRTEDGNTVCDFDPEEIRRHASLASALAPVEYEGVKINLIDTPGLFDFEVGVYESIRAVESVLITVSARDGLQVGAIRISIRFSRKIWQKPHDLPFQVECRTCRFL